jgi:hypothetical protein
MNCAKPHIMVWVKKRVYVAYIPWDRLLDLWLAKIIEETKSMTTWKTQVGIDVVKAYCKHEFILTYYTMTWSDLSHDKMLF